jgi:hypothetical protein
MNRRCVLYILTVIVICFLFIIFSPYMAKKYGSVSYTRYSPDKKYHLEILNVASFYFGEIRMDTPTFVRAYDINGKLFYESEIFDGYDNCRIFWPIPESNKLDISVGMDITIPISY